MILKNHVSIYESIIPDEISDKLMVVANIKVTQREMGLFAFAIEWIANHIKKDNVPHDLLTRVTCIFVGENEVTLDLSDAKTYGVYSPIIIYRVNKWREQELDDLVILTAILEELCHCYYHYEEEVLVKKKVLEILHSNNSGLPENGAYTQEALSGM